MKQQKSNMPQSEIEKHQRWPENSTNEQDKDEDLPTYTTCKSAFRDAYFIFQLHHNNVNLPNRIPNRVCGAKMVL